MIYEPFKTFLDVDCALYDHEAPYYYKAARGMYGDEFSPEWHDKRKWLTEEWNRLCPWPSPAPVKIPWWKRIFGIS